MKCTFFDSQNCRRSSYRFSRQRRDIFFNGRDFPIEPQLIVDIVEWMPEMDQERKKERERKKEKEREWMNEWIKKGKKERERKKKELLD